EHMSIDLLLDKMCHPIEVLRFTGYLYIVLSYEPNFRRYQQPRDIICPELDIEVNEFGYGFRKSSPRLFDGLDCMLCRLREAENEFFKQFCKNWLSDIHVNPDRFRIG